MRQWEKTAHSASRYIFHNHSVRARARSLAIGAIDIFFCLHTISLVRYNCTVWSGASHNCPPLFARRPRRQKRKEKRQIELRRYRWPYAPIPRVILRMPVVISFRQLDFFNMQFCRINFEASFKITIPIDSFRCLRQFEFLFFNIALGHFTSLLWKHYFKSQLTSK